MCLIGVILASLSIFVVMYWWSEGAIEASDAFVLAVVFGGLIVGLFAAHTLWQFFLAFLPLMAAASYAAYTCKLGSWQTYYKKRCQEYIAAIQNDPRNLAAREYLADALYNLGQLDRAIDEMQAAVDLGAGIECQYKLGKWTKERYYRDTDNPICRWCETENHIGAHKCSKCGADLPYDNAFTRWLVGGKAGKARYYLLAIAGVAIVGTSMLLLPLTLSFIPLLFCVLGLAGWSLIGSARA